MAKKKIHPKYGFLEKWKRNLLHPDAQHELWIGDSHSGKDYHLFWECEWGIKKGWIKLYHLWCQKWSHLREALTFMFPSDLPKEQFPKTEQPTFFNVRIYVPISQHMPKELPRGLVVPFTVSTDNLSKEVIHCLVGYKDPQQIYGEYQKLIKEGMNFSQLKRAIWHDSRKDIIVEKGYMDKLWVSVHRSNVSTISGLSRRLSSLNKEGILADMRYIYSLEKLLQREVKDQKTIVILYTGFIKNTDLRRMVMIYFTDVLQQTLQKYTANKKGKFFKHKIFFNEWETLAKPKEDKDATVMDMIMGEYLKRLVSDVRHVWGEVAIDVKGLENIDQRVRGKIPNRYVTRVFDEKELQRITANTTYKPNRLLQIFRKWKDKGYYRFLDIFSDLPMWKRKGNAEEGYELPRPRLCKDGKADMEHNSFKFMDGNNMKEYYEFFNVKDIQEEHAEYVNRAERKWIKEIKEKKQKEKEEKERTKERHNIRIRRIKLMQKIKHDNPKMTNEDLAVRLGVSTVTLHKDKHFLKGNPNIELSEEILNLPMEDFNARLNQGKI